jgi:hypothetical protein
MRTRSEVLGYYIAQQFPCGAATLRGVLRETVRDFRKLTCAWQPETCGFELISRAARLLDRTDHIYRSH